MARANCLRRNLAALFVCNLAAHDPAFRCCNAVDNSSSVQYSHNIGHYVLLLKRLEFLF